jgi:threonine dehydrogenase-like Zn-dependent dehydrogenase
MEPSTTHAHAFWIVEPGIGKILPAPLATPGEGDVAVEMLYSGISRGTETLVFRGGVPESQYDSMRCPHQEGHFPGPVKYGYSAVGRVTAGSENLLGQEIFCLYPHQDRFVVHAAEVIPLPPGLPPERAILAANLETALNGVWDAGVLPGDHVAVIGAGVIGLLVAYLVRRIPGTQVVALDIDAEKAATAAALDVPFALSDAATGPFDILIHASGSPAGLVRALSLAGYEATIVELSWFGDRMVSLPLGEAFHSRRLTLRSSQVGAVPVARRTHWSRRRRLALALELLADDRLDTLISGESRFDELPEIMAKLADGRMPALCHRIRYPH